MSIVVPLYSREARERVKARKEAQLCAEYGISEKSAKVLRVIMWQKGNTNAEIAKELDMQPRSVSGIVSGLIRKNLVEKGQDGRLVVVKND